MTYIDSKQNAKNNQIKAYENLINLYAKEQQIRDINKAKQTKNKPLTQTELAKIAKEAREKMTNQFEEIKKKINEEHKRIAEKYKKETMKQRRERINNKQNTMTQRLETLKNYPYFNYYKDELKRVFNVNYSFSDFCELVMSDEFAVDTIETQDKKQILIISGWATGYIKSDKNHIKALVILPKYYELTHHDFVKILSKTKAKEVKTINENKINQFEKIGTTTIKTLNLIGYFPKYSLNIDW